MQKLMAFVLFMALLSQVAVGAPLDLQKLREAASLSTEKSASKPTHSLDITQFYGRIINTCDEAANGNCFNAVVASGRTNFVGEGGDLANIYVPSDDYDTWRQSTSGGNSIEGEFVYQLSNDTLSCLTVELYWSFKNVHSFSCEIMALAANWDCHLDWGLSVTGCDYNPDSKQIEAVYEVVNLGPEKAPGGVVVSQDHNGEVRVQRKSRNRG